MKKVSIKPFKNMHRIVILLSCFLILFQCHSTEPYMESIISDNSFTYDLNNPESKWELPVELREISGLSYLSSGELACIQDENGYIYLLDFEKKKITKKIHFGKDGDYEGIEVINDLAYILRSDGRLFVLNLHDKKPVVKKIKTPLSKKNNTEGLGFDPSENELLIACKGKAGLQKDDLKGQAIYAFDIEQNTLSDSPKYLIKTKAIKKALDNHNLNTDKHTPYRFSGIAVHPVTNQIYIIGTVGKLIIIIDHNGNIKTLAAMHPKLFVQPESICFNPAGDLFIASEGKYGKGYILKFTPKQTIP